MNYFNFFFDKKNTFAYYILISISFIFLLIRTFFSSGEIPPDGIQYLLQAKDFCTYKVNFPLGYPLFIKIISFFSGSYLIASKIINILSFATIICFSRYKNFFFKETVLLFCFYPFINFFPSTLSEPLFFLLNYLIIYMIYHLEEKNISLKTSAVFFILFFLLVSVRFTGIFILFSLNIYTLYLIKTKQISLKNFLTVNILSSLGAISYLVINYLYSGFALGDRRHLLTGNKDIIAFSKEFILSVFRDFSFLNEILHKSILLKFSSLHLYLGVFIISLFLALCIFKSQKKFGIYLIISSAIIFLGLFYSQYTTKIDNTIRIKSNLYFYIVFFILINCSSLIKKMLTIFFSAIIILNVYTLMLFSETVFQRINYLTTLISKAKNQNIEILYRDNQQVRSNAGLLLFKAMLIDRKIEFSERTEKNGAKHSNTVTYEEVVKFPSEYRTKKY